MKKTQLLILIMAGVISFASAFSVSWFLKKKKMAAVALQATQQQQQENASQQDAYSAIGFPNAGNDRASSGMSERQLQHLIYDVRSKLKDCDQRQRELDTEAERIEISRQSLQEDIEHFNNLRDRLNTTLTTIRQEEEGLKKTLTEINTLEKNNFQRLASTYEKMDSTQAGRIMISMAGNNQMQDPVKILYYMNERMAGKLLSEIATVKPDLASLFCTQLKHVKEIE